jgi:phosphoribosylformimino-5-aminoimidazole carboxamide ribotide isomerase
MVVIPAIDLLGCVVVRLRGGKREEATVYDADAPAVARRFAAAGARLLHVVDLDGAFAGGPRQGALVGAIARAFAGKVQTGGGLRTLDDVRATLEVATYAVLGTAAVKDPELVREVCRAHPDRVIVAVDARDGRVAVSGWTEGSDVDAGELARRAEDWRAAKILYTDIARDGLRTGPNVAATARLQEAVEIPVIASGGIGSLDDLRALAAAGVRECVVGRALYEGVFTLEQAIASC